MSKSRQIRNAKCLTIEEIQKVQEEMCDAPNEESGSHSTSNSMKEEESINKKLSEAGMLEDGMSLEEKQKLLDFINESMNTAKAEEEQRRYESEEDKITKKLQTASLKSESELKNVDQTEKAKQCIQEWNKSSEKCLLTKSIHEEKDQERKNGDEVISSQNFNGNKSPFIGAETQKDSHGKEVSLAMESTPEKIRKTSTDSTNNAVAGDHKVRNMKNSPKPSNVSSHSSSDEGSDILCASAKKRHTSNDNTSSNEVLKRFKLENNFDGVDSKLSPIKRKPLAIEKWLERERQKVVVHRRSKTAILLELECGQKIWKESRARLKVPIVWAKPIVPKGISATLKGNHIPQHLLIRYQKYLISNNKTHPYFLPHYVNKTEDSDSQDIIDDNNEVCSQSQSNNTEENSNSLILSPLDIHKSKDSNDGETDASGRNKRPTTRVIYKEDSSPPSSESDEWLKAGSSTNRKKKCKGKQNILKKNPNKKGSKGTKIQATSTSAKQPVKSDQNDYSVSMVELRDRSLTVNNDSSESQNPFAMKNTVSETSTTVTRSSTRRTHSPIPETIMSCPVCNELFSSVKIESHAAVCASKTYAD